MIAELGIVIGICFILVMVFSLMIGLYDKYTPEGAIGILGEKMKEKHYYLNKSKFLFVFIFIMNYKWKKGYISKNSFWALVSVYIYLLLAIITEIIFMCFQIILRIDIPLLFVCIWIVVPFICLFIMLPCVFHFLQKNKE